MSSLLLSGSGWKNCESDVSEKLEEKAKIYTVFESFYL